VIQHPGLMMLMMMMMMTDVNSQLDLYIGNESVPIQLAQCWFRGLAISNTKVYIFLKNIYTEAILSNSTRKPLWLEITKMLIAL